MPVPAREIDNAATATVIAGEAAWGACSYAPPSIAVLPLGWEVLATDPKGGFSPPQGVLSGPSSVEALLQCFELASDLVREPVTEPPQELLDLRELLDDALGVDAQQVAQRVL